MTYRLVPGLVARRLVWLAALLIALHVIAMQANFNDDLGLKQGLGFEYWHVSIFDLDEEESFGTWFSALALLMTALLLLHVAREVRAKGEGDHWWWRLLGAGFCLLSMDEVVGLHEMVNTLLGDDISWTVLGGPLMALVAVACLPFLWRHRWHTSGLFVVAGVIYGGGAVGVEHFSGDEVNSLAYNMSTALEEGMEMVGVIVMIYAVLDHLRTRHAGSVPVLVLGAGTDHEGAGARRRQGTAGDERPSPPSRRRRRKR